MAIKTLPYQYKKRKEHQTNVHLDKNPILHKLNQSTAHTSYLISHHVEKGNKQCTEGYSGLSVKEDAYKSASSINFCHEAFSTVLKCKTDNYWQQNDADAHQSLDQEETIIPQFQTLFLDLQSHNCQHGKQNPTEKFYL